LVPVHFFDSVRATSVERPKHGESGLKHDGALVGAVAITRGLALQL